MQLTALTVFRSSALHNALATITVMMFSRHAVMMFIATSSQTTGSFTTQLSNNIANAHPNTAFSTTPSNYFSYLEASSLSSQSFSFLRRMYWIPFIRQVDVGTVQKRVAGDNMVISKDGLPFLFLA